MVNNLCCNFEAAMKKIIGYLNEYFIAVDKRILITASVFIAIAIFINYNYNLNATINRLNDPGSFAAWYLVFLIAFGSGYILLFLFKETPVWINKKFLLLLLIAPLVFAWKMVYSIQLPISNDAIENDYWNDVIYWPFKIAGVVLMLLLIHRFFDKGKPFYVTSFSGLDLKPYLLMLAIMVPLVAAASTQPDFLAMYPKFQKVPFLMQENRGWHKLVYELSYGSDFFTIELFFRGFLVLAFAKWVGKDAILPMALFYCTIHFGKPLGECISSYFGGMILGVVTFHTRSIYGGLLVHVGIAWLMELGGYLGHEYIL